MSAKVEEQQVDIPSSRFKEESNTQIWLRRFTVLAPVWTLLVLGIFFSLASDTFLRVANLNNILVQVSVLAIFGTGMTFVLLTGEIDLSIAAVAGLSGMVAAVLFTRHDWQEPFPTLAGLGVAILLGLISGVASTRFRIPTFMSTLAVWMMAGGLNTYFSRGRVISDLPEFSRELGSGRIRFPENSIFYPVLNPIFPQGFRVIIIIAMVTMLTGYLILRYTRFGRYVYMTGANKSAARLVGVNTNMVIITVLTLNAFLAGLAGLVSMGRLGSAQPVEIPSYLIEAIGAVVLGGTALTGGRGGIPQTLIGLLIYGTLRNGLDNIPQIDVYLKDFITGVILLAALVVNVVFSGKEVRDKTG